MDNVKITKLPPGKAYGADDLTNWSGRRLGGKFGVYDRKEIRKQIKSAAKLSKSAGRTVKPFERDRAAELLKWADAILAHDARSQRKRQARIAQAGKGRATRKGQTL
jgi:hypothetical protein